MSNIFLQLKAFEFKRQFLQKAIGSADLENTQVQELIEEFFDSDKSEYEDYSELIINLIKKLTTQQSKDKLFIALVYFVAQMQDDEAKKILDQVLSLDESVINKVRFLSHVYKSVLSRDLKKWLLWTSVTLITTIENSDKISPYANFVEHFDKLTDQLRLNDEEALEIYCKMIGYLQKHPVYKKLCSIYVIKSLQKVTEKSAQLDLTTSLILKAVKYGNISDTALTLLHHKPLHANKAYPIFQTLLTGDFQKLDMSHLSQYEKQGIDGDKVLRKMKIESIPRLIGTIRKASYSQLADLLKIKKQEVESYIIDAIKQGILKAKLDEFQECIIINRVNFRALRVEERAKLQRDITSLCDKLSK